MNKSVERKMKQLELARQVRNVEDARHYLYDTIQEHGKRSVRVTGAKRRLAKEESALVELVLKQFGESAS